MSEPILVAKGLWKSYGNSGSFLREGATNKPRPALIDVSLTLEPGQILGIVGESGSGKSTLARCLTLLERPDRGTVLFRREDLTAMSASQLRSRRRYIQTIFQDPYSSLNPRLTVGDTLAEVLTVHRLVERGAVDNRVAELLDQVGLPITAAKRYPADFSGGQRQRICIARALAAEPVVIIADEPVSALDVSVRAQIVNLLVDLNRELNLAVIFIGHDLILVDHIAQNMAVMLGGQIVELLPANLGLEHARHPYTKELLAAVPRLEPREYNDTDQPIVELSRDLPTMGCPYWQRCPHRLDPKCETQTPTLREIGPGHFVASFYDAPTLLR